MDAGDEPLFDAQAGRNPTQDVQTAYCVAGRYNVIQEDGPCAGASLIDLPSRRNLDDVKDSEKQKSLEGDLPQFTLVEESRNQEVSCNLIEHEVLGIPVLPVRLCPRCKQMIGDTHH